MFTKNHAFNFLKMPRHVNVPLSGHPSTYYLRNKLCLISVIGRELVYLTSDIVVGGECIAYKTIYY